MFSFLLENSSVITVGLGIGINVHQNRIISFTIKYDNNIGLMSTWDAASSITLLPSFYEIKDNYFYYETGFKLGILFRINDNF